MTQQAPDLIDQLLAHRDTPEDLEQPQQQIV